MVDGLKPGQRKILYACFKRNLKSDIKVRRVDAGLNCLAVMSHDPATHSVPWTPPAWHGTSHLRAQFVTQTPPTTLAPFPPSLAGGPTRGLRRRALGLPPRRGLIAGHHRGPGPGFHRLQQHQPACAPGWVRGCFTAQHPPSPCPRLVVSPPLPAPPQVNSVLGSRVVRTLPALDTSSPVWPL